MKQVTLIVVMMLALACNCFAEDELPGLITETTPALDTLTNFQELASMFKADPNMKQPRLAELIRSKKLTLLPKGQKIVVLSKNPTSGLCLVYLLGRWKIPGPWEIPCQFVKCDNIDSLVPKELNIEEKLAFLKKVYGDLPKEELLRMVHNIDKNVNVNHAELTRQAVNYVSSNREKIVDAILRAAKNY